METTSLAMQQINHVILIESSRDKLVEMVEKFFEERRSSGSVIVPLERSQFENILRVAISTSSVKEVINFIRYQIGRERSSDRGWRNGDFGEKLIRQINEVAGLNPSVAIRLVRLFLGFLGRHAIYEQQLATSERS